MNKVWIFIWQYWQEITGLIAALSFLYSLHINLVNRKMRSNLYYLLREIEITSGTLMDKIKNKEVTLRECREAFRSNRSIAAGSMRIIAPTPFTRAQYERGPIYRFLLKQYWLSRSIKNAFQGKKHNKAMQETP